MTSFFQARYAGRCGNCGQAFAASDPVTYSADDTLIGQDCCDGIELDEDPLSLTPRRAASIAVMPRGKTVKDRCPRCFQIPSGNNTCGCD